MTPHEVLHAMFRAAVDAADPARLVPKFLPAVPRGRTVVVGAGKAAAAMAAAFERNWRGHLAGVVVTRHGYTTPCERICVREAAHPVPDIPATLAACEILSLATGLGRDDLLVALISGGGSSLLSLPAAPLSLADKQEINRRLLQSGADIAEMNCVRKHLSAIKGGRLALAAAPAKVHSLVLSDVPGDDPATVASGPTLPDPTTSAEALDVLVRYGIRGPAAVIAHLQSQASETPKPGDAHFERNGVQLIGAPQASLEAAARVAAAAGYAPMVLSDCIEGESREVAKVMSAIVLQVRRHSQPLPAPCALISGGETTVTVRGSGRGGRNVEFLLALALQLRAAPGVHALAADTDGVDGAEEIAGACIGPHTMAKAQAIRLDARDHLARNDAHAFFEALGEQLVTGPTLTNVNDFRAILVDG